MKTQHLLVVFVILITSCSEGFLDLKSDKQLVIPSKVEDYQAMLDYTTLMNRGGGFAIGELVTDDYYITEERFNRLSDPAEHNGYIWAEDMFTQDGSYDWNRSYARVLTANVVLEGLNEIGDTNDPKWREAKGGALFHRSNAFHLLTILFGDTYKQETADQDLGIPLRTTADIYGNTKRASMRETYQQILKDLSEASTLLPDLPLIKTRPSKASAHALMARCYLQMGVYDSAGIYADIALQLADDLIDYNMVDLNASYPFEQYNDEVIFSDATGMMVAISRNILNVDSVLFASYETNDLRKYAFFYSNGIHIGYKGSYNGSGAHFIGIKTPELFLIRAEAAARTGNVQQALDDLNHLLRNRYLEEGFVKVNIQNPQELLQKILVEKRKEMVFSGLRWAELKRLNKETQTQTVLKRNLGGHIYELRPDDARYNLPIPNDALVLGGFEQN